MTTVDARRHGELLASSIDTVLAKAGASRLDLTAVAAGTGPGPYTGLRAGLVTARVLGSALGIPVLGVGTLDVIAADAAAAAGGREFIVATDARRREVYWARYGPAGARLAGPAVGLPADLALAGLDGPPVAGTGPLLYPDLLGAPIEPALPGERARWPGWPPRGWPRVRPGPARTRSTCAARTPGCQGRRSG